MLRSFSPRALLYLPWLFVASSIDTFTGSTSAVDKMRQHYESRTILNHVRQNQERVHEGDVFLQPGKPGQFKLKTVEVNAPPLEDGPPPPDYTTKTFEITIPLATKPGEGSGPDSQDS